MPFADFGDVRIYHEVSGDGPRVLYISGTGSDLRRQPNVFAVPDIGSLTLAAYDHRLMGQSSIPETPQSMADFAGDAERLLDHLGWDTAAVAGVSFGGMVAQHLALRVPHRVSRLVLCCTSPGGDGGASYPLHEFAGIGPDEYASALLKLSDRRRTAEWEAANPEKAHKIREFYAASARDNRADPVRRAAQNRQFAARAAHDTWARLPELTMPVLIAAGRYDDVAPMDRQENMLRVLPDARLQVFEGGHLFMMEDPAAWPTIIRFLKGDTLD
ncbi:MAG: alpha/beta fold hydrolase [Pseudomonadota bacterium]|nr:alpha/beta fold hydrolase [Pseudomonadota bacterium]